MTIVGTGCVGLVTGATLAEPGFTYDSIGRHDVAHAWQTTKAAVHR